MLDAYTDYELLAFFPDQFTTDHDRERHLLLQLNYLTTVYDKIVRPDLVFYHRLKIVDHLIELRYSVEGLIYVGRFKIESRAVTAKKMNWHIHKTVRLYKARMLKLALRPVTSSC